MRAKFWAAIVSICLVLMVMGSFIKSAHGGTCSSISRTNASANSVLTSSKYNSDLNTVYTAANDLDAGCLTDGTLELGALNTSDFDVLLNSMQVGCKVSKSDAATLSVGKCRLAVDGTLVKTSSATTVTWGCTSCASESTGTEYYLYATTSSTASSLDLLISTTAPDEDGYSSTSRALGKFYNDASGDIDACIYQWRVNGWGGCQPYKVNALASDLSSNTTDITSLKIEGLENGKSYRLSMHAKIIGNNSGSPRAVTLSALHDGSTVLEEKARTGLSDLFEDAFGSSVIFEASAPTVTFNSNHLSSATLLGDGTTAETFVMIEELEDHVPSSRF